MLTIHTFALKKLLLNIFLTTFSMAGKPEAMGSNASGVEIQPVRQLTQDVNPQPQSKKPGIKIRSLVPAKK